MISSQHHALLCYIPSMMSGNSISMAPVGQSCLHAPQCQHSAGYLMSTLSLSTKMTSKGQCLSQIPQKLHLPWSTTGGMVILLSISGFCANFQDEMILKGYQKEIQLKVTCLGFFYPWIGMEPWTQSGDPTSVESLLKMGHCSFLRTSNLFRIGCVYITPFL